MTDETVSIDVNKQQELADHWKETGSAEAVTEMLNEVYAEGVFPIDALLLQIQIDLLRKTEYEE
jgi:hypothetical protein